MKNPSTIPLSTVNLTESATTHLNLTVDAKPENTNFDEATFWKAMKYYTNSGALKSLVGSVRTVRLTRTRPFVQHTTRNLPSSVRRINEYAYLGFIFWMPQFDEAGAGLHTTSPTVDVSQAGVEIRYSYEEWNKDFDQTAM